MVAGGFAGLPTGFRVGGRGVQGEVVVGAVAEVAAGGGGVLRQADVRFRGGAVLVLVGSGDDGDIGLRPEGQRFGVAVGEHPAVADRPEQRRLVSPSGLVRVIAAQQVPQRKGTQFFERRDAEVLEIPGSLGFGLLPGAVGTGQVGQ